MLCKRTYVVLGMGRSSTSFITEMLRTGIFMGNELGDHCEDQEFLELNNLILASAGGAWHCPPPEQAIIETGRLPEIRQKIEQLIDVRNNEHEFWGWKDPRTSLTIRCYFPFLKSPHFLCCFRDVHEVSQSLFRIGIMNDYSAGRTLAREYNKRITRFLSEVYA